jgi:hypothetical protein
MNPLLKHLYRFFLLIALAVVLPISIIWGQNNTFIQPRILFLVDGSSSMLESWQANQIRFKAAGKIIDQIVDSIHKVNPNVEFGLRVYGHQHTAQENNCFDTKLEVPFGKSNATQLFLRMNSLKPLGVSPIAYSLKEAAENDLINTSNYNYSLILITDGGESCNGNICEVVKLLLEKKIKFQPYIIGLINYQPLELQYACLGTYLKVTNDAEATLATNTILQAYKPKFLVPELKTTTAEDYLSGLKANLNEIKPINRIAYFKIVIAPKLNQVKLLANKKPLLLSDTSDEAMERKIDTIFLTQINSLNKLPYVHLAFENTVLKPYWLSTIKLLVPETPVEVDTLALAYLSSIKKLRSFEIKYNIPNPYSGMADKKITYRQEEESEMNRDTLDFIASKQLYYFYKQAKAPIGIVKTKLNTKYVIYKEEFSYTPDSLIELLAIRIKPIKFQTVYGSPNRAYTFANKTTSTYEASIEIEPTTIPAISAIAAKKIYFPFTYTIPNRVSLFSKKTASPYEASIELEPTTIPSINAIAAKKIYFPFTYTIPNRVSLFSKKTASPYEASIEIEPTTIPSINAIAAKKIYFPFTYTIPNRVSLFSKKTASPYEASIELEPTTIPSINAIAAKKIYFPFTYTIPNRVSLFSKKTASPYEASIEIEPTTIPTINTIAAKKINANFPLAIPVSFYVKKWKLKSVVYTAEQEIEPITIDGISPKNISKLSLVKNNSNLKKHTPRFKPNPILKPTIDPTASLPDFKEQGNEAPFTSATQADTITSVAVLFTNGKGKFYKSTPQVLLKHPKTGEVLRKFYRTTDARGNPDPQTAEAGTYTLTITGQSNTVLRNVKIEEGVKNIITVVVGQGTLRFSYKNNPKRPVKEYQAIVNCRSDYSPTIYQQCAETLVYEPGNYYVEINTLPTLRKNVDFEFGVITDIYIPEPGTLQFTNSNNFGKVALLFQSGDRFMEFKQVRIGGNLLTQKLELQPGAYQVLYYNSIGDRPKEIRIPFFIKSNETVELELK